MKYHSHTKELAAVRILSNTIGKRNRQRRKTSLKIDVRPLDQREHPLKGLNKTLIVPQGMTGEQLKFFYITQDPPLDPEPEVQVLQTEPDGPEEPAYIKKYKNIMK